MQENIKPQLHSSHLSLLYKCGEKFRRVVIEGEREPSTIPLVVGSATHATVARNLNNVIIRGSLLPREAVQDFAKDDFIKEWKALPIVLNQEERNQGIDKTRDIAQDVTIRLVTAHHYDVAPKLKPKQVERKWVLEAPNFPFDLSGAIDVDEGSGIRDTKSRKSNLGQGEVDTSEQYTFYAFAKYILDGILIDYVAQDNLVKPTLTRDAYAISYYSTRTMDDFQVIMRRWEQANSIIKAGIYTPADPQQWWCSPSFCGFFADGSCPYANIKSRKAIRQVQEKTNPMNQNQKEGNHGRQEQEGPGIIAELEGIVARDQKGNIPGSGVAKG